MQAVFCGAASTPEQLGSLCPLGDVGFSQTSYGKKEEKAADNRPAVTSTSPFAQESRETFRHLLLRTTSKVINLLITRQLPS